MRGTGDRTRPVRRAERRGAEKQGGEARGMPGALARLGTIYLPLTGLIDVQAETQRVRGEIAKTRGFLQGIEAKLANEGFTARAPEAVV